MAMKTTVTILVLTACMLSLVSCTPEESTRNDISGTSEQKPEEDARSPDVIQEDSRLALLDSCTFQEALDADWGFTIALVPVALNENTNLGVIVKQDKDWVGNYGGGFANCGVIGIEPISTGAKRFNMEIWKMKTRNVLLRNALPIRRHTGFMSIYRNLISGQLCAEGYSKSARL